MKKLILVLAYLLLAVPCGARTITVDDDGPADFNNIQAAINDANDGDIVEVMPGTYTGTGNKNLDFKGKAITIRSANGPEATTIDCQNNGRGFYFHNGEGASSVLDGFTIANGHHNRGGGIYCYQASPTITNCIFEGNWVSIRTSSTYGGGIYCWKNSSPTLNRCIFRNNSAWANYQNGSGGGAAFHQGGASVLKNCIFVGNSAYAGDYNGNGGGIYIASSNPELSNCTFIENTASHSGGGIGSFFKSNPTVTNCILWDNSDSSSIDASSQIYGVTASYSCIMNWTSGGTGNIGDAPLFADPNNEDYHLLPGSPCIDAGDPNYIAGPNETDLDGNPRVIGGRIDMGAYEFNEFNHQPVADAGPNQVAYAWIDGFADVNLDGSASYDDDNDVLDYYWNWTINGNTYDANGVSPVIELPVGEHTIELIVNDGIDDSEPDQVTITVIGPMEARLCLWPHVINRRSRQPRIMAWLRLPQGITKDQVDEDVPLILYPGGVKAIRQFIIQSHGRCAKRTRIFAFFNKAELMDAVPENGRVELQVVGQLKSGQYFYGSDTISIIAPQPPWPRLPLWPPYHRRH